MCVCYHSDHGKGRDMETRRNFIGRNQALRRGQEDGFANRVSVRPKMPRHCFIKDHGQRAIRLIMLVQQSPFQQSYAQCLKIVTCNGAILRGGDFVHAGRNRAIKRNKELNPGLAAKRQT
jgi:tetrahydromethanopterin S-methyltransferase subunit F